MQICFNVFRIKNFEYKAHGNCAMYSMHEKQPRKTTAQKQTMNQKCIYFVCKIKPNALLCKTDHQFLAGEKP